MVVGSTKFRADAGAPELPPRKVRPHGFEAATFAVTGLADSRTGSSSRTASLPL